MISSGSHPRRQPRIAFVAAVPETIDAFLVSFCIELEKDYEVHVIADYPRKGAPVGSSNALSICVPISRSIRPVEDLRALLNLFRLFRRNHYEYVISITPKAGLLAMVAARLAGVPKRVHWFTGQVWVTKKGVKRKGLKFLDQVTAAASSHLLADSPTQREFLIKEGISGQSDIGVLGDGSVCGVDTEVFKPNQSSRIRIRQSYGITDSAVVVLYVGRIVSDKGLHVLTAALPFLRTKNEVVLMIVGPDEENLTQQILKDVEGSGYRVLFPGASRHPEEAMSAADIFCMPSFREGFGLSTIEASACQLPCVASDIYGLRDAIEDGVTGWLFPPGDYRKLATMLDRLIDEPSERLRLGREGRNRVRRSFSQERITSAFRDFIISCRAN